jgi:hypothetical protein
MHHLMIFKKGVKSYSVFRRIFRWWPPPSSGKIHRLSWNNAAIKYCFIAALFQLTNKLQVYNITIGCHSASYCWNLDFLDNIHPSLLCFYGAQQFYTSTHPVLTKLYVDGHCEVDFTTGT